MKTFDYNKAWWEWALPSYLDLRPKVRSTIKRLAKLVDGVYQESSTLYVPRTAKIDEGMGKLTVEELAWSAAVVQDLGHWYSPLPKQMDLFQPRLTPHLRKEIEDLALVDGRYWKWSNMVGSFLTEKFLMEPNKEALGRGVKETSSFEDRKYRALMRRCSTREPTISLNILDGVLRSAFATRDCWMWERIGVVSVPLMEKAQSAWDELVSEGSEVGDFMFRQLKYGPTHDRAEKVWKEYTEKLKEEAGKLVQAGVTPKMFDSEPYMVEEVKRG